jgi:hypothetical protein
MGLNSDTHRFLDKRENALMKLNLLLSISAIYLALLGVGFLFAPEALGFGVVPVGAAAALLAYLRTPASAFIGIGVLNWMARDAEPSTARNAIVMANAVGLGLSVVITVWGLLSGAPIITGVFAIINLLLAIGFFWFGRMTNTDRPR